jgi:DNA-binding MarR family transcriptional regulator
METPTIDSAQPERYENILHLISFWRDFEKENERTGENRQAGLEEFSVWMQQQLKERRKNTDSTTDAVHYAMAIRTALAENNGTISHQPTDADGTISILLGRMGRYAKLYTKKALDGQKVVSIDEFVLLAAIMQYERTQGEPTKSEVYSATLTETTTGSEIMRRLEKSGLVEEYADTKDKRMKRVRLTPSGKGAFFQTAQQMGAASHIIAGSLTNSQKAEFIYLLTLLDTFHSKIYTEHRAESFADIEIHAAGWRGDKIS